MNLFKLIFKFGKNFKKLFGFKSNDFYSNNLFIIIINFVKKWAWFFNYEKNENIYNLKFKNYSQVIQNNEELLKINFKSNNY